MSQPGGAGSSRGAAGAQGGDPSQAGDAGAEPGRRRRRVRPEVDSQTRTARRRRRARPTGDEGSATSRRRASRSRRRSSGGPEATGDGAGDAAEAGRGGATDAGGPPGAGSGSGTDSGPGDGPATGDGAGGRAPAEAERGAAPGDAAASPGGPATSPGVGGGRRRTGAAAAAPAPRSEAATWWWHPVLRTGAYAWALIGIGVIAWAASMAAGALGVVVVPVLLALFPAALLYPAASWLRRAGVPAALASLLTMLGLLLVLAGVGTALAPQVADEIPEMTESAQEGIRQLEEFLDESAPFGVDASEVRAQIDQIAQGIDVEAAMDVVRAGALGAATAVAEVAIGALLLLVVLFFYLKDGERLGRWLCRLFPASVQDDAEAVGLRAWVTIGAYFRGQLLVALLDAIGIGIGLVLLGVPLALPLSVLVFFGGLFPIVGAIATATLAVLVALATRGVLVALVVLGIAVAVQQLEGNVVGPYVLGRATALHPLAVLTVITAGGLLLGVLGAFLAVPITASIVQGLATLRSRRRARSGHSIPAVTGRG